MAAVEAKNDNIRISVLRKSIVSGASSNEHSVISPAKSNSLKKESIFPNSNVKPQGSVKSYVVAKSKEDVIKSTGLSEKFIDNLVKMEGFKLNQYADGKGNKSIGIGHNISADPNYKYGSKITKEQAYNLLKDDLIESKKELKKLTNGKKFTPNQEEALIDLVFNVGEKKLKNSKLIKLINEGKLNDAASEFDFIKVNKIVSTHLCKRRMQNISTFYEKNPSPKAINSLKNISQSGLNEYDREIHENKGIFSCIKLMFSKFGFKYRSNKMISTMTENYNDKISHK